MSGYLGSSFAILGQSRDSVECCPAVMRMVPPGLSRSSFRAVSSACMSSNFGPTARRSRSPASVGATLRVVRVSNRPRAVFPVPRKV